MTVKGFHDSKRGGHVDPVVKDTLSEFEKHLCKTHLRVEILGKKGRKVPVLLTKAMQANIELLLKKRSSDSEYLFARANNSCSHYRGSDSIREFASKCGAKHADLITSTKLRKQLATLAQVLNLKENSQDILATFQGHDIRIHREFYRLPSDALELAKVSRLLHCINNGTISKFKGLDFDEIEFDKEEMVEEEDDEVDEDDEDDVEQMWDQSGNDDSYHENGGEARTAKSSSKPVKKGPPQAPRHVWTREEKAALERQFPLEIKLGKTPGQLKCQTAINSEKTLASFSWKSIKYAVRNIITSRKRIFQK